MMNKKLIIITGKSASGKDTLIDFLTTNYNSVIKRAVVHTTRSPREGEVDGISYHFVDDRDFMRTESRDDVLFVRHYPVITSMNPNDPIEIKKYCLTREEASIAYVNKVVIADFKATQDIIRRIGYNNCLIIYLDVPGSTRYSRLVKRGDNPFEARRRILDDETSFDGIETIADLVIKNDEAESVMYKKVFEYLQLEGVNIL